ncbi:hypothetical protein LINPERHAP2_LOCUS11369 [Linum perenne]
MSSEVSDLLAVKFNGKNYDLWSFQFRLLVQGKSLLPYLDGTLSKPSSSAKAIVIDKSDATAAGGKIDSDSPSTFVDLATWEANNARVFSWIVGSVNPSIAMTLRTFTSAADVWTHLRKNYSQINASRVFEVEYEITRLQQGDMDVRSFHLAAQKLWTEQDLLSSSLLTSAASDEIRKDRHRGRVLQFLIKLRPEFESVRSQLIQSNTVDMDTVLGDLCRAETRLKTQAAIDGNSLDGGSVFAAQSGRHQFGSRPPSSGYTTGLPRPQSGYQLSTELKCRHCGESGHAVSTCRKRNFCNYCKKPGHIITECRKRSFRNSGAAYSAGSASSATPSDVSSVSSVSSVGV